MSGYIEYFKSGGENMSFMIQKDNGLEKYIRIWKKGLKDIKHKVS